MDILVFGIILVLFISSLVRSTFGFGDALIAMPLLALFVSIKIATPLVAMFAIIIAVSILWKEYKTIDFRSVRTLILFALVGIPFGLLFLKGAAESIIKIVLGIILILFALYNLFKPGLLHIKTERWAFVFGFISGMLGGAYNTNGPPIIIYGAMRKWQKERFRAMLQSVFLPTNAFIVIGHISAGLWTEEIINLFLYALPFVGIAIFLGTRLSKIIPTEKFVNYVYLLLIVLGALLFYSAI